MTTGLAMLLGACSAASAPAAASAPNGAATVPAQGAPASAATGASSAVVPAGAAAGGADACALLTKVEVESAFGETMQAPVASVDHGDATCTWTHEAAGLDLTVKISSRPSTPATIKAMAGVYGDAGKDVAGVGDAAFEAAGILEFVKGTTMVVIGTGDGPGIITDAKFQALCKTAAGRV